MLLTDDAAKTKKLVQHCECEEPLNMCKGLNVDDTRDYWLKEGSGIF